MTFSSYPIMSRGLAAATCRSWQPFSRAVSTVLDANRSSRRELAQRLDKLSTCMMSSNWNDSLNLVLNVPFWEAEAERISSFGKSFLSDPDLNKRVVKMHEIMDVMFACEDVRDHINELAELATRATGVMGIGLNAGEAVENMEEQMQHCSQAYDDLVKRFPEYKPKIEQSVGHGLAVLRSKQKFNFSSQHRYFF